VTFAAKHDLPVITIEDLVSYRKMLLEKVV
jgi:3,4-dihydroxy-2-butanone 4-phosphate synthase